MLTILQNITQFFIVQNAIGTLLHNVSTQIDSHAACIISNRNIEKQGEALELDLKDFPTVANDCQFSDSDIKSKSFLIRMQQSVAAGCSLFVTSFECSMRFLDNFQEIHDWVEQKYEKKILVVVDTLNRLTYEEIMEVLDHRTVIDELPLTQLLQPNLGAQSVDVWSAYPFGEKFQMYNRFFFKNFSFEFDKQIMSKVTDLNGLPVIGAFIHYPPYTAFHHVPPGTGNANLFNSNESLVLKLDGQEHILLMEFCLKYNCTLTGRLEYDADLWGDSFPNHTGTGLTGALTTREANVSCAALYLWDNTYEFMQYTAILQRATITHIVPKPLPLPYWETPILPFPGYIWSYVIGSFLIGAVVLFIVNVTQTKIDTNLSSTYGLFDSIYAVFMMSIFQGVSINIHFMSNIVIFTVILIYALVIGNLYAGGLASVMTITRYEEPVDSIEKLVESKFMWGSTALSWIFTLQKSDYPPHKKYVEKYMVNSIPETLKLVQQHKTAIMLETMQHGTLTYQEFIDRPSSKYYMLVKKQVYWQGTIIMASKTWPFMEQLNRMVFMQQESGINYYWEQV
ncbi:Glutamate receptor, partial [Pseudolycoriella hygida]